MNKNFLDKLFKKVYGENDFSLLPFPSERERKGRGYFRGLWVNHVGMRLV
jgi:hypothetical protein